MRAIGVLVVLAVLLTGSRAGRTDPQSKARERLEALTKRLPEVVKTWWAKSRRAWSHLDWLDEQWVPAVRRVRALGEAEAKVTIHVCFESKGKRDPDPLCLLTVSLRYHAGLWTAVRFQWSRDGGMGTADRIQEATHFLLDAIDEAAEK